LGFLMMEQIRQLSGKLGSCSMNSGGNQIAKDHWIEQCCRKSVY